MKIKILILMRKKKFTKVQLRFTAVWENFNYKGKILILPLKNIPSALKLGCSTKIGCIVGIWPKCNTNNFIMF